MSPLVILQLKILAIFFIFFGLLWTFFPGKSLDMYKKGFQNYNRFLKRLDLGYEYSFKVTDKKKYMRKESFLGKLYILVGTITLILLFAFK